MYSSMEHFIMQWKKLLSHMSHMNLTGDASAELGKLIKAATSKVDVMTEAMTIFFIPVIFFVCVFRSKQE
jgi:hypothetical protein